MLNFESVLLKTFSERSRSTPGLRSWIQTPGKARRAYHWEPKHPKGLKATMYRRVSVNLGTRPRRLGRSTGGRNVNTKGEKEAAKGKAKAGKETVRAREESEL